MTDDIEEKCIKYTVESCIQKSSETINSIYDKYKNDDWMLSKIYSYINNQLPNVIENIKTTHVQRIARMEELTSEQDTFVH